MSVIGSAMEQAINAFSEGDPVLIHDFEDREGETDIVYPAPAVQPENIAHLRNEAGGLICVALGHSVCTTFGLPFLANELDHPISESGPLGYGERSSFSLPVNFRETYTGITDEDRALTIRKLGEVADNPEAACFSRLFRTPGHVHLLRAAPDLLSERQGHTELGISLARLAGLPPAVVVCEMLDDHSGTELSKEDARAYARTEGHPFLEGDQLVHALR